MLKLTIGPLKRAQSNEVTKVIQYFLVLCKAHPKRMKIDSFYFFFLYILSSFGFCFENSISPSFFCWFVREIRQMTQSTKIVLSSVGYVICMKMQIYKAHATKTTPSPPDVTHTFVHRFVRSLIYVRTYRTRLWINARTFSVIPCAKQMRNIDVDYVQCSRWVCVCVCTYIIYHYEWF